MFTAIRTHKTLLLSLGFLVLFSVTVTFATPPTSPYPAGSTLDPSCAPGASNCTVTAGLTPSVADATYPQLSGSYANPSWIASLSFSKMTNTPTTLGGYGIADAYTKTQSDANYLSVAGGTISGTNGAGFIGLAPQASIPTTPASGVKLYSRSTGALSWIGVNGFTRSFSGTNLTADHTYALPNADVTLAGLEATQNFTGANTFTTAPTFNSALSLTSGGTGGTDAPTARVSLGLAYATTSDITNNVNIAAWGDSLTAGTNSNAPYPTQLSALTGNNVYNGGVGGETSTQIKARFDAAASKHSWSTIIWAGRNNYSDPTTVKSDIAAMVAALGHSRYIVISVLNSNAEPSGSANYNTIMQLNADLAATYGSHFIDMRSYLVSLYNPGIPQDVTDHGNDVTPSSLRVDALHLNSSGYAYVAQKISQNIGLLQSSQDAVLTQKNAQALFASRNQMDVAVGGQYTIGGMQVAYLPNQINFPGSFILGNGGKNLLNTTANEGYYDTFVGIGTGLLNTTGYYNTGTGYSSLSANTTGFQNTGNGFLTLVANTTGSDNTATGSTSMQMNLGGSQNSAYGSGALAKNTSGSFNTGIGYYSLNSNLTSNESTAIGYSSLYYNTGAGNTAIGSNALKNNIAGASNTVIGRGAAIGTLSGSDISNNVIVGYGAGAAVLTGANNNTLFGYQAGANITTGANNVVIGYNISAPVATGSNQLTIGNLIFGTGIDGVGTGISTGKIGIGTNAPAQVLDVVGSVSLTGNLLVNGAGVAGSTNSVSFTGGRGSMGWDGTNGGSFIKTSDTAKPILFQAGASELMRITGGGAVGIGINAPSGQLTLGGARSAAAWGTNGIGLQTSSATYTDTSTAASGTVTNIVANSFAVPTFAATNTGVTYTNAATLYIAGAPIAGTNATLTNKYAFYVASGMSQFGSASVVTGTTVATFQNAGGTCVVIPSATGSISCSSDMTLKKNITTLSDNSAWSYNANISPDNQSVLAKILALSPVDYNWNVEQDTDPKHAGFIAQEVRQVFPDLVTEDANSHVLSLNYTGLVPYTIQAIKEMNLNITDISNLDRPNNWRDSLITWLGSSTNGIANIFSKKVTTDELSTQKICVGQPDNQVCVTKDQLQQLLQGQASGSSSAPMTTTVTSDPATATDPTVVTPADGSTQSPEVSQSTVDAPAQPDPAPAATDAAN
jgi:lysophospholipase L1-like esterase